jgi:UMP-CMP kinase
VWDVGGLLLFAEKESFVNISQADGNPTRRMLMAFVHDMGESLVGDITPSDGVPKGKSFASETKATIPELEFADLYPEKKHKLELLAMRYLEIKARSVNPDFAAEMMKLWLEFEEGETQDARIVHDMDRYECAVQLFAYEKRARGTKKFDEMFQGQIGRILTAEVKPWGKALVETRDAFWATKSVDDLIIFVIGSTLPFEHPCLY